MIAILLLESNISYEFDLDLVICESMNSNLTFRIHSILYATVVMMLIESAIHFFLHCPLYSYERHTLLNGSVNIDQTLLDNTDFSLTQILLFGNTTFNAKENTKIINLTVDFVLSTTNRFDEPLLWIILVFLSSPFNNDSSDNKRILSEASRGL